ncbi:MAG: glycerol-3-phosphate dehydrogenase, partial [Magnetovibrio sp.]|nr:glycerol-3-phosphate dehydrogenase [Magnetovibrio sp.]
LKIEKDYPFINHGWARRLARSYGTRALNVLADAKSLEDMGVQFGATLSEREVIYLIKHEWAHTGQDIIWRRSKLGLLLNQDEQIRLDNWVRDYRTKNPDAAE